MLRIISAVAAVLALAAAVIVSATSADTQHAPKGEGRHAPNGEIVFRRFADFEHNSGAIFAIQPNGSHERQLTHPPAGSLDDQPSFSGDGSRIVFTRQPPGDNPDSSRAFWTMKPDGTDARLLSPGCSAGPPKCLVNEQRNLPLYSPDGRHIAFGWAAGEVRDDIGQIQFSEVYVMKADGSHSRPVTHFTDHAPYTQDSGPAAWSPDSRRLVIARVISPVGEPASSLALFVIKPDGTGLRQLTPWALRAGGRADWSPVTNRILFRTIPANDEPGGDIYTIKPDGTGLRQLTHFPPDHVLGELAFSPDGESIVFTRGDSERDMYVMRADGSHIRQITTTELSENWPSWQPEPQH
jgi:TolB protein